MPRKKITNDDIHRAMGEFKKRGGTIKVLPPEPDQNKEYYTMRPRFSSVFSDLSPDVNSRDFEQIMRNNVTSEFDLEIADLL